MLVLFLTFKLIGIELVLGKMTFIIPIADGDTVLELKKFNCNYSMSKRCITLHWDKNAAGKRYRGCIFVLVKDANGKIQTTIHVTIHVYEQD